MSPKEWCVIIWVICGVIACLGTAIMERKEGSCRVNLMDLVAGIIFAVLLGPGILIMFLVCLADVEVKV